MSTQSMSTNRPYQDEPSTLDSSESRDSFQNEPRGIQGGFKDDPNGETFTGDTSYQIAGVTPPTPSSTTSASPLSFHLNELWHNLCQGFTSLRDSPPELYKAFVLKFLDSYSYFSFSIIFTLFLSNDFGMDDVTAGTLYGAWGALITIYGLLTGFVVDNLGVARSLRLGFALSLLARIGIFMTTSKTMLYFHICGTLPLANCLGIPVLTTGIRRYTNETNRGFAFGLFYVIMNVAALISGPVVDMLTIWYKGDNGAESTASETTGQPDSWSLSSYRAIVLTGIISNVLAVFVSFSVREIKVDAQEHPSQTAQSTMRPYQTNGSCKPSATIDPMIVPPSPAQGVVRTFRPRTGSPWMILRETFTLPAFRRFLLICLIMLNVRMIFRHLDATLPKYMVREFGPDVAKGTIYSINPAIIIILVPIVTAMTSHVEPLVMMHYGSYISAASVFILALSTSIWACIVFVTVLSIGEAIWSPRLYDYTVSVCPEGREGTFMALSSAPLFLAKLPVGFLSGILLQRYCPLTLEEGEERHSQTMWLIIGLLTASSPVLMTCCWTYISKTDPINATEFDDTVSHTELKSRRVGIPNSQVLPTLAVLTVGCLLVPSSATTVDRSLPARACVFPHDQYPFCDASLPLDIRIDDLVSRLTLEEKPWLLTARYSPKGNISRLGIPEYDWGANCMHGVQSRCAPVRMENGTVSGVGQCPTSFPNANSLGATFNKTLWKAMGSVIGIELRSLWLQNVSENTPHRTPHLGLDCWSPNINIQRDPRWGRNLESPSEDPYLCGIYGMMHTMGLQNNSQVDNRYLQAVATLKHFDANSIEGPFWTPEGQWSPQNGTITRHNNNAVISLYDMTTTYLPAFAMSVKDGGAAGVMCSFNRINGVPSCANEWLLQQVLRQDWNFRGYVTSDTGGLDDIRNAHHYTSDWNETVIVALRAGCDVESAMWYAHGENDGLYIDYVPNAVRLGLVSEADVDRAVKNALEIRFRLGLFDPVESQPFWNIPPDIVQSESHVQLSREATAQSLVLLKNDGDVVPIDTRKKVALIGPHIHDRSAILGNYLGEVCRGDASHYCVTSIYEGFNKASKSWGGEVWAVEGCQVIGNDTSQFDDALHFASLVDTVIFVGGLNGTLEGEDKDRPDIRLPKIQELLIQRLAKVNSRIILVLLHGGMIGLDSIMNQVQAIVSLGYPGPYIGTVLPAALFGLETRAWGKTPITWYHDKITKELNILNFDMGRSPGRTYRYYEGIPNFRFGHGLNPLTTFELSNATNNLQACCSSGAKSSMQTSFAVSLTNTGKIAADEVVMSYFVPLDIPSSEPASRLREQLFGFDRVHLAPTASMSVSFPISTEALRLADRTGTPVTFPGKYLILITNGLDIVEQTVFVKSDNTLCINNNLEESKMQ